MPTSGAGSELHSTSVAHLQSRTRSTSDPDAGCVDRGQPACPDRIEHACLTTQALTAPLVAVFVSFTDQSVELMVRSEVKECD